METALLIASLILIGVMLLTIIFLTIRCNNYREAYLKQIRAIHKLVDSDTTYEDALAIMMGLYQLDEDEVIRRLTK